jgi:hypothetical protein
MQAGVWAGDGATGGSHRAEELLEERPRQHVPGDRVRYGREDPVQLAQRRLAVRLGGSTRADMVGRRSQRCLAGRHAGTGASDAPPRRGRETGQAFPSFLQFALESEQLQPPRPLRPPTCFPGMRSMRSRVSPSCRSRLRLQNQRSATCSAHTTHLNHHLVRMRPSHANRSSDRRAAQGRALGSCSVRCRGRYLDGRREAGGEDVGGQVGVLRQRLVGAACAEHDDLLRAE